MCQRCQVLAAEKDLEVYKFLDDGRTYIVKHRKCDECGEPIPHYVAMQGSGFQSLTIDHFHAEQVLGVQMQSPVTLELCHRCYLRDFAKHYPTDPLPVIRNVEI
jgi:hypothetical protein